MFEAMRYASSCKFKTPQGSVAPIHEWISMAPQSLPRALAMRIGEARVATSKWLREVVFWVQVKNVKHAPVGIYSDESDPPLLVTVNHLKIL